MKEGSSRRRCYLMVGIFSLMLATALARPGEIGWRR